MPTARRIEIDENDKADEETDGNSKAYVIERKDMQS